MNLYCNLLDNNKCQIIKLCDELKHISTMYCLKNLTKNNIP